MPAILASAAEASPEDARAVLVHAWAEGVRNRELLVALHNATLVRDCTDGIAAIETALAESPDDPELLNLLAMQWLVQGDLSCSRTALESAARAAAPPPEVFANLARLEIREGQAGAAASRVAAFESAGGDALTAHRLRAQLCLMRRDFVRAEEHLRAALALEENALTLRELADLLLSVGRPEDAIPLYLRILQSAEENAEVWGNLAYAQLEVGQAGAAERAARRAIEVTERYSPAWRTLGRVQLARGEGAAATVSLRRAIALGGLSERDLLRTRCFLADAYLTGGDPERAVAELRRVATELGVDANEIPGPDAGSDEYLRLRALCRARLGVR